MPSGKPAEELPVGNTLSKGSASKNDSMVNNDFVDADSNVDVEKDMIPMLRGTAKEQVPSTELPRQLSQASLDALEAAKQEKLSLPLPEVNAKRGPLEGGFQNPKVAATKFQPKTTAPAQTSQQRSSAFPGHFLTRTPAVQQQVTSNQFFNRAAKSAPEKTAEPAARVCPQPFHKG